MAVTDVGAESRTVRLSLPTMTAMVVGGMVGAGVFSLGERRGSGCSPVASSSPSPCRSRGPSSGVVALAAGWITI